ncbi:MAG TPA: class I SAM-dependent methyltransferase [Saprospiraceae bacterium]|nr:class I SAM-dependent methyltransferase [Saprospiraceae bacterium]HMP25470.1 class I SAM-dependent methyltransferase [Saprospiraceae bacterium]
MHPTTRFSRTVEYYVRYRPAYPAALLDFFRSELQLKPDAIVADIGSGTGLLTELFLRNGNRVWGVEPNPEMRAAGAYLLRDYPHFTSLDGSAEATTLPDQSVDFVAAGTAFHWFDPAAARREWRRILRAGGQALLIWNYRHHERSAFMQAYEAFLLEYATDYRQVKESYPGESLFDDFFGAGQWQKALFENVQIFDFEGIKGRYLSCSYALPEDNARFPAAMDALHRIFERYQTGGCVEHWYHTVMYWGRPGPAVDY